LHNWAKAESTAIVNAGELVVLSAGNVLTSELLTREQRFSSVLFYFSNEDLNRFLIKYEYLIRNIAVPNNKQPFLIFKQDIFIRQFAASIQQMAGTGIDLPPAVRLLKIEELLFYLLQSDSSRFCAINILTRDKEQLQLKKVVESHASHQISVDELAFLCHMSISTFKRRFNEIYNNTPRKWFLSRRMEMAAELLRSAAASPSGIYLQVGYQNHSSFTEAFRNHFGCTPSEYQQQQLNVSL
jgi:AraC-like DNA-binding protein